MMYMAPVDIQFKHMRLRLVAFTNSADWTAWGIFYLSVAPGDVQAYQMLKVITIRNFGQSTTSD